MEAQKRKIKRTEKKDKERLKEAKESRGNDLDIEVSYVIPQFMSKSLKKKAIFNPHYQWLPVVEHSHLLNLP